MNFTEKDVLAVQADAFERARELVLRLLSRKPIVNALDVQAIGNPYDGRNGFDRADQPTPTETVPQGARERVWGICCQEAPECEVIELRAMTAKAKQRHHDAAAFAVLGVEFSHAAVMDLVLRNIAEAMAEVEAKAAEPLKARITELEASLAAATARASELETKRNYYKANLDAALTELAQQSTNLASARAELAEARESGRKLEAELTKVLCFAPRCRQCGKSCEPERWVYVIPTCYQCLPPPEPIGLLTTEAGAKEGGGTDGCH